MCGQLLKDPMQLSFLAVLIAIFISGLLSFMTGYKFKKEIYTDPIYLTMVIIIFFIVFFGLIYFCPYRIENITISPVKEVSSNSIKWKNIGYGTMSAIIGLMGTLKAIFGLKNKSIKVFIGDPRVNTKKDAPYAFYAAILYVCLASIGFFIFAAYLIYSAF